MEANRDMMKRVPVREQDPKERATNFKEVCLGYDMDEAMAEAVRCLNCKNAQCVKGCPVSIDIPAFVQEVKEGNIEKAAEIIAKSSALPAVCGRVCPQESQCEGNVSEESRESLFPSESWSVLLLTGQESTALFRRQLRRRTVRESLSLVPALQDLPVQAIWPSLDMK